MSSVVSSFSFPIISGFPVVCSKQKEDWVENQERLILPAIKTRNGFVMLQMMLTGSRILPAFFRLQTRSYSGPISRLSRYQNLHFNQRFKLHTSKSFNKSFQKNGATVTERATGPETPVIVILGWNGSKDKHLNKYSDLFEERQYSTVSVTANPFNTFFRSGTKVKEISHHILDILMEMNCKNRPVFLYSFSNGGGAVFFHIMEALTSSQSKYHNNVNVAGSIFDSCPINPDIKSVKTVQESVTESISNPILKLPIWYGLGMFIPIVVHFSPTVKRYMHGIKTSSLRCNELVLYSKSDRFSPYIDINDYVNERRRCDIDVVAKCWDKSGHVNHFREHTDEYLNLVYQFIDDCLEKNK